MEYKSIAAHKMFEGIESTQRFGRLKIDQEYTDNRKKMKAAYDKFIAEYGKGKLSSWSGKSTYEMAAITGDLDTYQWIYRYASNLAHSNSMSGYEYLEENIDNTMNLSIGASDTWVKSSIVVATILVIELFGEYVREFNLDKDFSNYLLGLAKKLNPKIHELI